jgi:predicted outer membrane repeat protein
MYFDESRGRLVNCMFRSNSANRGGAIFSHNDYYPADPHLVNCVFFDNESAQQGSAYYSEKSSPKLRNCTIVRNRTGNGGAAVYHGESGTLRLFNCIVKGNSGGGGSFAGDATRHVRFSNIGGGHYGPGKIDVDPRFVNVALGDLRLKPGSKCIDAGSDTYIPDDISVRHRGQLPLRRPPRHAQHRPRHATH